MPKHGKNYRKAAEGVEKTRQYDLSEAVNYLKNNGYAKFDETVEVAVRLGVNASKSDQMVRGTVALPHGTGTAVRVVVFATGDAADAARAAGADEVGMDELVEKVAGGWNDFDIAIATTEAMREVRKLGKVLGPRGLMPNPKTGTVTEDTGTAVGQFKAGRVEFKMDRNGNCMVPCGKLSFDAEKVIENAEAVVNAIIAAKPASAKGIYIKRITLTSTMGPGLTVGIKGAAAA